MAPQEAPVRNWLYKAAQLSADKICTEEGNRTLGELSCYPARKFDQ